MAEPDKRAIGLKKLFNAVIRGERELKSPADGDRFLEALCAEVDVSKCVEVLIASSAGLSSVARAFRFSNSSTFINGHATSVILRLSDPSLKQLYGGQFLQRVVETIVNPPSFWNTFVESHHARILNPAASQAFAWLLLEVITSRSDDIPDARDIAEKVTNDESLISSESLDVRNLGQRIKHVLSSTTGDLVDGPGGRHDNDHADFRRVKILPTSDEFVSNDKPFYRRAHDVENAAIDSRGLTHIDNQFRLLREDLLGELRTDFQIAFGQKKGRRKIVLTKLQFAGIDFGLLGRRKPCMLKLRCLDDIPQLRGLTDRSSRKNFITDPRNKNVMKHQSLGCLVSGGNIVAFATVERDEDLLAESPAVIMLRITEEESFRKTLLRYKSGADLCFVQVDTAVFAFEPILKCLQTITDLPLQEQLLNLHPGASEMVSGIQPTEIVNEVRENWQGDLQATINTGRPVNLDAAQTESLITGLTKRVSLIQGPPGTGKSYVGALIAKVLKDHTHETILVLTFTNHALDQFLEDLQNIGIPNSDMLRLGSKASAATKPLSMYEQKNTGYKMSTQTWNMIDSQKSEAESYIEALNNKISEYSARISDQDLLDYLEFSEDSMFFDAFAIPANSDGMILVGRNGKALDARYLLEQWSAGKDAGIFRDNAQKNFPEVWSLTPEARMGLQTKWVHEIVEEQVAGMGRLFGSYNRCREQIDQLLKERKTHTMKGKRIIGCTTTAAAMHTEELRAVAPGIVLVEEAGEILESHILTALSTGTKQLILIGDHKQLRPKVNNYALTVANGDGYNLDVSLFERMVLAKFPHSTLAKQHRMRPEISSLVRKLTYPELEDADATKRRPALRGFQDNVIFVAHSHPELNAKQLTERRDEKAMSSKENIYEADMVLQCVRYLGQQGYGTEDIVVLTPYLGQLFRLMKTLAEENDPYLNDLDSFDLIRAGLLSPAAANISKRKLRISTIDNYQGEESDIVIVCLTRSNDVGDIGFMSAPQRVNVMLSRARNALILLGNPDTFVQSRKGKDVWIPLMDCLKKAGHVYNGFPVRCEQHQDKTALLTEKEHFKMKCEAAKRAQERRRQRDHKLDEERQAKQRAYLARLVEIEDEIEHQRRLLKSRTEVAEQDAAIAQKEKDLRNFKQKVLESAGDKKTRTQPPSATTQKSAANGAAQEGQKDILDQSGTLAKTVDNKDESLNQEQSDAKDDWEHQKKMDGAQSEALDSLMSMIGLESVKEQFLSTKSSIDTFVRQDVPLSGERFGAALLGNPGTGKTTVARLYAKFLGEVGALPGDFFFETSGSALANDGVSACKDHVQKILEAGGGVFFIDETYQLVSGNSPGGKAVLDYLLAEIENLTGKIAFVLAGYHKQMEAFFAHNPGIPSRIPIQMEFQDYEDHQLQQIFCQCIDKKYKGSMKVEDGLSGLFVRIVARRIGRGRGREGFGNARDVQNKVSQITTRQAKRLRKERKAGLAPDDNLLTKEDLIGPEPASALRNNPALMKLQTQIGLASVKQTVQSLLDGLQTNYRRELEEKPLIEYSLNKCFIGSPGTGKTTVAKLYGRILADIGLLSNGEVIVKNPADFTGSVLGGSEAQTKAILASTVGKVLIIDEAYMLNSSGDIYKAAVIDTIVAEVQSTPGEDRCVLLLGYKEQMEDMMRDVNPGLARRFPIESAFVFEDFSDGELRQILDLKLASIGFKATDQAKNVAMDVLQRARNRPNFGNAGEVDIILDRAKGLHQKHMSAGKAKDHDVFEAIDFDPNFDRGERAATNLPALFRDVVGCEDLIKQIQGYQTIAANLKAMGMDPREQIPFSFLFKGPPGTGKTTTAQKMGKVFYDMGFLSQAKVIECSATDLIGQYVGQTGPKVQKQLESAMGKVLFIDEAYRLAEGPFATEAMDELVDSMTKPKFAQKLVIILAGYDKDIDRLMSMNPGLTSRFPESIIFKHMAPGICLKLLSKVLGDLKKKKNAPLDLTVIDPPSPELERTVIDLFTKLSELDSWGNARDVKSVAKGIFGKLISTAVPPITSLVLTEELLINTMQSTLEERSKRSEAVGTTRFQNQTVPGTLQMQRQNQHEQKPPETPASQVFNEATVSKPEVITPPAPISTEQEQAVKPASPNPGEADEDSLDSLLKVKRDSGVSDAVWEQLERDKHAMIAKEREYKQRQEEKRQEEQRIKNLIRAEKAAAQDEERRRLEQLRIKAELQRRIREAEMAAIEEERKKEMEMQRKIKMLGPCPMGYHWIKGAGGYRCAGGAHWLSDAEIDAYAM
ncbi:hypothetical protein E8E13_003761 [Curvularia kusanoi]|uniref:AAA+ ATPase domain-containing protein n=1 Tax=Curvularia kusanoi TaxID=90978 RepID=A0A9P4T5K8_CURKU|nr:hypothetical protein E8E13_003761 [Curvularia kusanoi]